MKTAALLRWSPLIGLLVGLLLASWLAISVHRQNQSDLDESFDLLTQRASLQLQRRMQLYEYGLRGSRGALIAGGDEWIGRERFLAYSASRDYAREFPGARGFGFIRRVPASDEEAFLQHARADGWPDFSIRQLAPHAGERFVIQYIEPVANNRVAVGLDVASESNRRNAAIQALRTGSAVITDPITLVQVDGKKNQGFLILLPAYRVGARLATEAEREAAGYGWVYAPLSIEEVLRDFDFYEDRIAISISAVDGAGAVQPFYQSGGMAEADTVLRRKTQHIEIFGKEWQLTVQEQPALAISSNLNSPWLAFGIVLTLSLVGTIATYMLQRANSRIERAEADSRLNDTNRRYRQLIDGVRDYAIIQIDTEGRVTGWNSGAERIKGYSADEILGRHMSVFYPPGEITPDALDQRLAAARESGFAHDEGWRVRKDGSRFWASVTITPIHDDEGQITGYSKITRDLTEKRTQEIELKRLVSVQKAILDNAGVAIITTDMKGFITLFNPSAERLLGYRSDEVTGKLTPAAFHDRDEIVEKARALSEELGVSVKPGLATLGAKALRGEVDTNEWTYVTKSGQRKPVLLSVTGIFDDAGTPLGTVGLAADLTEQKRYQTELVSARVAAERANMAKSSFLANMSHEIRTPMNAILGMTQLVLQGPLDPQQRSLLEKAFAASKALLNILNDVLDYSKVEAGHMQLEVRELSLETLLANAASLFAHQAEQKGLEFILDIPPDLPTQVLGDPLRLTQVLSNLLSNALKFTSEGSVTLSARTERTSAQMCRVRFSIADSGIGMNRSQIAQLFKPFTQADASVTRKYGGTGLGLSICKRLVELMGGVIEVRSTPGQGSEFFFDIDMALPVTDLSPPQKPSRLPFQRALIVDDQIAAAHVLQVMLHSWKVDSSCCDSAVAAVEELKQAMASGRPFDLVVTDLQMPEMDGLGLVDRIQQLVARGSLPHVPTIVMVSMYAQEDLMDQLQGRPIAALLSKPVLPSALLNALTGTVYEKAGPQLASPGWAATYNNYISAAAPLRGKRILLAEDNEVNQQVATAFLQSAGLEVSVACNGLQAVEMAQSAQFAAILMDMHMPEMDGLEATRQIRSIPACATTPIIAMTAAVMQEDKKACFDAGMDDFVGKPIEPEELIGALRKWTGTAASPTPVTSVARVVPPSDSDEELERLRLVEGVDIASAITRMGGDRDLYLRLIQGFASRADSLVEQLKTLPLTDLPALAHKVKGECANLGLTLMASSCADLEVALKQRPEQRPAEAISLLGNYLRAFSAQMVQTVPVAPRISDDGKTENSADEDWEEVVTLLDQLPALLKEQRMQALKHSERLQEILKGTRWQMAYLLVHSHVNQLQFAAASGALREFRSAFDGSLR